METFELSGTTVTGLMNRLDEGKAYYEIRLESIGGLGANLCGKMLGELGVKYLGLNSSSFSSYGSEKTGTPVKGYIRYCKAEKEIRVHSPVVEPDLLVVFHQALFKDKSIWKGVSDKTSVIVAIEQGQEQADIIRGKAGAWFGIEAQKIAMETHSRINVVMLGAALRVMGIYDVSVGEEICRDTLGKKYPDALDNNLEGIRRGYEEIKQLMIPVGNIDNKNGKIKNENPHVNKKDNNDENIAEWGYDNAPIGGVNPRFGSTVIADLSPSRQGYIPLFIKERCINCGLCHSACPDMVFQFARGEYKGREMMVNQGLDYYHCKGCLRCVDVCPVNALVRGNEAEHAGKEYFIVNRELIRMPEYYEEAGPDGYITSESFLTEKRMDGGEV